MQETTKSTHNPKYTIDLSINKYETRYDRLLNILFYAKELPSDLYTQMNMSYVNYRKAISILKQRDIISTLKSNGTIGYILTSKGRNQTHMPNYMKYSDCLKDKRQNDITRRNRKRQFAYLYALCDRAGIAYEDFLKPSLTEAEVFDNKVFFYTALDLKKMLGIEATIFTGSRLLGFFMGRGKIIPVYRTNQMLKTFGKHEIMIPELMKRHFSVLIDSAVLICDNKEAVIDISNQIMDNENSESNEGINTANYNKFYIIPSDDTFLSHFKDLYTDHNKTEKQLIQQYNVTTSKRDNNGKIRFVFGTGFINDNPILLIPGNINIVKAKTFIEEAKTSKQINYIVCQERDVDYIKAITSPLPIKISTI